ncbi:MAG: hypothetical protein L0Y70_23280 [Gemmataceae bacterium]|nr:hypothetical protein [Gemmataceae bacterium]
MEAELARREQFVILPILHDRHKPGLPLFAHLRERLYYSLRDVEKQDE